MKKTYSFQELERRAFLQTVGKSGLSMGLMKSSALATSMMFGRTAHAAGATGIKNIVFYYVPLGTPFKNGSLFNPKDNALNLPAASAPMESIKNECVFFKDALISDDKGNGKGGHGDLFKCLGGAGRPNTLDVELAKTWGSNTPFSSLLLGVRAETKKSCTQVNGRSVNYQDNAKASFERMFGKNVQNTPGGAVSNTGGGADLASTKRAQSVLDTQKEDIKALRAQLTGEERERLDQHLDSIEKLEQRLSAAQQPTGSACANPGQWLDDNDNIRRHFGDEVDITGDLAILALQCQQTKIASVQLANSGGGFTIPELNWSGRYHASMHKQGGDKTNHTETRRYLSERFTLFIEKLKAAKDSEGNSLLDSTLVLQTTCMADGQQHSSNNAPFVLAGGGSAIQRGSLASCGRHTNILDTIGEALGVDNQIPTFGDKKLTGILT